MECDPKRRLRIGVVRVREDVEAREAEAGFEEVGVLDPVLRVGLMLRMGTRSRDHRQAGKTAPLARDGAEDVYVARHVGVDDGVRLPRGGGHHVEQLGMPRDRRAMADDHPVFQEGVETLLSLEDDMEIVARVNDGAKVESILEEHSPDILLLDLRMPGMGGLDTLKRIRPGERQTRVIILTASEDQEEYVQAITDGASGVVPKQDATHTLSECIRSVHAGQIWLGDGALPLPRAPWLRVQGAGASWCLDPGTYLNDPRPRQPSEFSPRSPGEVREQDGLAGRRSREGDGERF